MSETPKNPFTMVGSEDAAACVDGVCEVPPVHATETTQSKAHTEA